MKRRTKIAILAITLASLLTPLSACKNNKTDGSAESEVLKTHTIRFYSSDGTVFSNIVAETGKRIMLPEPTSYIREFGGWFLDEDCNIEFTSSVMPDEDIVLYAKWTEALYTITFHSLTPSEIAPIKHTIYDEVEIPTPELKGYVFEGWYHDSSYTEKFDISDLELPLDYDLYAKWSFNSNYIKCVNTIENTISYIVVSSDEEIDLGTPTYDDYVFEGWYLDNKYETPFDPSKKLTENITVYTKWNKKQHTIEFVGYDDKTITGYSGNSYKLPVLTVDGYDFLGWSLEENDSSNVLSTYLISKEDVKLYPILVQKKYKISFVTNSEQSIASTILYFDKTYSLPTPTKKCYKFLGWYFDMNYAVKAPNELAFSDLSTDVVLYAKWELVLYSITYVTGFDDLVLEPSQFRESAIVYPTIPEKPGYTFEGWYLDSEYKNPFNLSVMDTNNYTVYAKWTHNEYKISIKYHDGIMWKTDESTKYYGDLIELPEASYRGEYCTYRAYIDQNGNEYRENFTVTDSSLTLTQNWILGESNSLDFEVGYDGYGQSIVTNYKGNINSDVYVPKYITYNNDVHTIMGIGPHAFNSTNTQYIERITLAKGIDIYVSAFEEASVFRIVCEGDVEIATDGIINCRYVHSIVVNGTVKLWDQSINNLLGLYVFMAKHIDTEFDNSFVNCPRLIEVHTDDTIAPHDKTAYGGVAANAEIVYKFDDALDILYDSVNDFILFYNRENDTYKLIDYCGEASELTFPEYVYAIREGSNGTIKKQVSYTFGEYCLHSETVKKITLPSCFDYIPKYAFAADENRAKSVLTTVYLDGVVKIDEGAFMGCEALTYVNATDALKEIGASAFEGCKSLQSFDDTYKFETIGKRAFANSGITRFYVPSTMKTISEYAFAGSDLEEVIIDNTGFNFEYAFADTTKLSTARTLTNVLDTISKHAFYNSSIESSSIVARRIGEEAFANSKLKYVTVYIETEYIESFAYCNCYNITYVINKSKLDISINDTKNGYVAYYANAIFTDEIDVNDCLYENEGYKYIKTTSDNIILYDYPKNTLRIDIPEYAHKIGYGLEQFDNITIKPHLFENTSIEAVTFNCDTVIGENAFMDCKNLEFVDFFTSTNDIYIGAKAFSGTTSITNIDLTGIKKIGTLAFANSGIEYLTIDNAYCDKYAFNNCISLIDVTIKNVSTSYLTYTVDAHLFDGCPRLVHISYYGTKDDDRIASLSSNKNIIVEYNANTVNYYKTRGIKYMVYDNVLYVIDVYGDFLAKEKVPFYDRQVLEIENVITTGSKFDNLEFETVTLIDNAFAYRKNFNIILENTTILSSTAFTNTSNIYILYKGSILDYEEYTNSYFDEVINCLDTVEVLYDYSTSDYRENTNYWTIENDTVKFDIDPIPYVLSSEDDLFEPIKVFPHQEFRIPNYPEGKNVVYWYNKANTNERYAAGEIVTIDKNIVLVPYYLNLN